MPIYTLSVIAGNALYVAPWCVFVLLDTVRDRGNMIVCSTLCKIGRASKACMFREACVVLGVDELPYSSTMRQYSAVHLLNAYIL